eukprot:364781-Chlamydomonas_euryale.AAC.7
MMCIQLEVVRTSWAPHSLLRVRFMCKRPPTIHMLPTSHSGYTSTLASRTAAHVQHVTRAGA